MIKKSLILGLICASFIGNSYAQTSKYIDINTKLNQIQSTAQSAKNIADAALPANGGIRTNGTDTGTDVSLAISPIENSTSSAVTSRTVIEHFSDVINVADYGAKCDGSSFDDAPAFTSAITEALTKGRKVIFNGKCHFATPVSITGNGWVGMDLDGSGSTITTDKGISGISIETDTTVAKTSRIPISFHDFTLTTTQSSTSTVGLNLKSDIGWTFDNNYEYNITISNFTKQLSLINVGENHLLNSALFSPSNGVGYYASGLSSSSSQWANNNIIDHVEATGGTCVLYNGALQGDKIFELGCMNAVQGVIVTNGDLAQSFEVHNSYFDVTRTGVNLDGYGLSIIDNNSADVASGTPDATYGYTAFSAQQCSGCKVTNNFVFGLGSSTNTPIVAGGSQIVVTGNYVRGLDGHLTYCIEVQTPTSLGTPDHILFANNSCWAAGTFNINGDETRIFGSGNVSSGSGSSSSTTNGALAPTQNDYGPIVLRKNDLPTGGSFFRVGNLPSATQAFISANLASTFPNALMEIELGGVSKFNVLPNGTLTVAGSVKSSGFSTVGGSMLWLDSNSKGAYINYDDTAISNAGGLNIVGVNGQPTNLISQDYIAAGKGFCMDTKCTTYMYEDSTTKKIIVSNTTSGALFSVDSSGNIIAKGTITQNGTP